MKTLPCLLTLVIFFAVRVYGSPLCSDEQRTRDYFHRLCDYIVEQKSNVPVIFTGGYYMRDRFTLAKMTITNGPVIFGR